MLSKGIVGGRSQTSQCRCGRLQTARQEAGRALGLETSRVA